MNITIAILLEIGGYALFAFWYFLKKGTWNGYLNKQKQGAALATLFILALMLVLVPEVSEAVKAMTGLEINIENSKVGFVTIGFALSGIVSTKLNEPINHKKIRQ